MKVKLITAGVVVAALVCGGSAGADVLCRKKSGIIVARSACRKKEAPLNLADFGAAGPTGPPGAAGTPGADGQLRIYGDGSAGDVVVSANTTWDALGTNGNRQFRDCTVAAGVTLTVPSGTVIRCAGGFTNEGTIVVGPGALGGAGSSGMAAGTGVSLRVPGAGSTAPDTFLATGGSRGIGLPLDRAEALRDPFPGGGGGSYLLDSNGGAGGGGLLLLAQGAFVNSGTIRANGEDGEEGGGGGGGGGVVILASPTSIATTGPISAKGGVGSQAVPNRGAGGGGGGGIVRLIAPSITADDGTIDVAGGDGGAGGTASAGDRSGGGGGGACGGDGGRGGSIVNAPFNTMTPGDHGAEGHVIETQSSPTALF
jgi:hypothetical protein